MSDNKSGTRGEMDAKDFYKDEPVSGQKAEDLLAAARLKMLMEFPFFGKIAQNMTLVETDQVPTTAVDPKGRLYFNRKWVNHMTIDDAVFEFAHETGHLYQRCFERFPEGANHGIWNKAADWRVDTDLVDAGLTPSKISKMAVDEKAMEKTRELGYLPAIYKWMLVEAEENTDCAACKELIKNLQGLQKQEDHDNKKENKALNGPDSPGSGEGDDGEGEGEGGECKSDSGGGSGGETKHTCGNIRQCCVGTSADMGKATAMDEQKWMEVVIAAKMHAESKGNMPGNIGERIDTLTKSTVRWQDHLKSKSSKIFGRDRYSFRRYNRRGAAMKVRLPRALPDGKTAVIACDTSGSMSTESCVQCITEAGAIMKACGADKLWLILHDYVPYFSDYVTEADLTKLKCSRGGTSHQGVFQVLNREYVDEEMNIPPTEEVELAIMFTDLGTDFPEVNPKFEVIWGVPEGSCPGMNCEVPFGTKVPVPIEGIE
jgi:predicted metal-dependent peptidase